MTANSCESNIDHLKLIHQGTSQDQRISEQLKPDYVRVDEREIEHALVFAKVYSQYLNFYANNDNAVGDWHAFFSHDISVQLATAAIQDVEYYKITLKESFDVLNNLEHQNDETELKNQLGYLFSSLATLAQQLDALKESLPKEILLKQTIKNLIQNYLASGFQQLILYYRDGETLLYDVKPKFDILGTKACFKQVRDDGLSNDWLIDNTIPNWQAYLTVLATAPETKIYGSGSVFERINRIATHNLFTAIFDQFLKVFARVVFEAKVELEKTLTNWNKHEPHYALFLAFLKLLDYAKVETNTFTKRHLDFYYRDILKLKEKPAKASHAHLLIELAKHIDSHELKAGELFRAGKDALGIEVFFANQQNFVANRAKVTALKTLYRYKKSADSDPLKNDDNRLFASPIANSADGLGAKLTTIDQSWHPFTKKIYDNGKLTHINMPKAELGFAIASHYLWLAEAEGTRTITVAFTISQPSNLSVITHRQNEITINDLVCLVSTSKNWFPVKVTALTLTNTKLILTMQLEAADPAITPYSAKTHGYQFATNLPLLLVKLVHHKNNFIYATLENITVQQIDITVAVDGLKTLAVSNDFGTVDTSKPFQPFGALPVKNSALVIGSKEIFQKKLTDAIINITWQNEPIPYNQTVKVNAKYLKNSNWQPINWTIKDRTIKDTQFALDCSTLEQSVIKEVDFSKSDFYRIDSKQGFIRLEIDNDFGQRAYELALIEYINQTSNIENNLKNIIAKIDKVQNNQIKQDLINIQNIVTEKPVPPIGPFIAKLSLNYTAKSDTASIKFFHLYPFGHIEQSAQARHYLLPQFYFELNTKQQRQQDAEFYIGIAGLSPPQNLALFFQVADGSADPLIEKPESHIHWSYLSHNEWYDFDQYDVQDNTNGLIQSGIITFAIPDNANLTNTVLPSGQYWLRAAVTEKSDAVCQLLTVSAQGLKVTFQDHQNDVAFLANALPAETINKLKQPDAAVKQISQPFASFGGRAAEQADTFYTRVSERLRHKDRSITLWDYERLILEAFPQIYRVKCLNHTQYDESYHELAPGHLTIVTIPNQQFHNLHDPLRPYTSLGLLKEIENFLKKKLSCFVKLHVKNPLFEEVRVSFKVKFYDTVDKQFYTQKLNTAITQFLSPWAFSNSSNPTFGGKVYLSTLINFVEEQAYVDYVSDFSFIMPEPDDKLIHDTERAGSKAISILVSAKSHDIQDVDTIPDAEIKLNTPCPCTSS